MHPLNESDIVRDFPHTDRWLWLFHSNISPSSPGWSNGVILFRVSHPAISPFPTIWQCPTHRSVNFILSLLDPCDGYIFPTAKDIQSINEEKQSLQILQITILQEVQSNKNYLLQAQLVARRQFMSARDGSLYELNYLSKGVMFLFTDGQRGLHLLGANYGGHLLLLAGSIHCTWGSTRLHWLCQCNAIAVKMNCE